MPLCFSHLAIISNGQKKVAGTLQCDLLSAEEMNVSMMIYNQVNTMVDNKFAVTHLSAVEEVPELRKRVNHLQETAHNNSLVLPKLAVRSAVPS